MFELFEHTADIGVRGFGKTWEEAFAEGAKAMTDVMTNVKKVKPEIEKEIEVEASDLANLFVNFLNELIFFKDVENLVFSKFDLKIQDLSLKGKVFGQKFGKLERKTDVKAATYNEAKASKTGKKYLIQCVLDI